MHPRSLLAIPVLDELPTAVMLFGDAGMVYANPAARTLFDVDDGPGRSPLQVLDVAALAGAVTEAAETGRAVEVEVEYQDRSLVGRASVTAEGQVALAVTDLTEVRRVEAVRRDFVTNASHELKTPVAGIQALSESLALALDLDPERARAMIRRLQLEAERLATLVRELLDLTRLEEADSGAGRQRVDLAQLVSVQLDRLRRPAEDAEVRLISDCAERVAVIASPADLRLIVANLLANAIQYNRPGGEVRASVRRTGNDVELVVADTGIGIPEADLDRVFERFYRVDKARSRAVGGTGLGLAITRHAVQRHGGRISVDSTLGVGSTFTVTLPVEGSA